MKGTVKEVFFPEGEELEKIGFKVQVGEEIITIIENQGENNNHIYREDEVSIVKTIKDNQKMYTILSLREEDLDE